MGSYSRIVLRGREEKSRHSSRREHGGLGLDVARDGAVGSDEPGGFVNVSTAQTHGPRSYPQVTPAIASHRVTIQASLPKLHMSTTNRPNRFRTGVSLDPEISAYLDDLALRMGTSRSWVLNTIVYEYAKFMEHKNLKPLASREAIIRL